MCASAVFPPEPARNDGPRPPDPATVDLGAELARYQALVEYAPDAIVILDLAAGHFVTVNRAAEQLFGMDRQELLGVGPVEVSPPVQPDGRPSQTAAAAYIARALAGEQPRFEWVHRRADGTDVPCEIRLLRLPSPDRQLVRGSLLDITERREAEAARAATVAEQVARRAAEAGVARLRATIAGLNAVVWERDPTTLRLTFVNERAEQLLGYPATQWLTDEGLWERMLHPDDRDRVLARVREEVAGGGVDFELSYRLRAADERWVWLHHLGHVARDEDGAARTLHGVLLDITAAKRREHAAALLAAVSQALAAPDTVEERLTAVAELVVGELGDWGAVWLRADDEQYRPFAAAPAGHARRILTLAPVRVPEQFAEQVRAGRAFAVPQITDGMRREATVDQEHYAALTALGGSRRLVAPLTTGGEPVGLLTVAADARKHDDADVALVADLGQRLATMVAAERLAAQRWALHELSVALSAAGTVAEAAAAVTAGLRRVLGVAVVSVCLLGEDGLLHEVDIAGYPADRSRDQYAARRLSDPFPLTDAARTRHPIWLPDRAAITTRYPAVTADLLAQTEAVAALPLLAGSRVVGGLATTFRTPRRFDADERTFLLTVAGQIAAAFERAALADVRREMAETLQRSLLPGALPQLDRLAVTARYLPAVAGTQAGGDWYDVLTLADGCVAVVVGDVVGHGAPAAAVMGQLRAGLANLLLAGHPPADALELLDRFADQVTGAGVSTVACLVLDPVTRQVTYSRAGHPAPLVIGPPDAGPAGYLDDGLGPALTVHRPQRRPQAVATLPPGATLLLYTDGLVERRGAILDDGLDRLAAAATARGVAPLPALVDGVLGELVAADGAGDDIALVAVRLLPAPLRLDGAGPATALRGAVDRSPR